MIAADEASSVARRSAVRPPPPPRDEDDDEPRARLEDAGVVGAPAGCGRRSSALSSCVLAGTVGTRSDSIVGVSSPALALAGSPV
mgnify:CR=1 FL=1